MVDVAVILKSADEQIDIPSAEYHNGQDGHRGGDARPSSPREYEDTNRKGDAPDHCRKQPVLGRHLVRRKPADLALIEQSIADPDNEGADYATRCDGEEHQAGLDYGETVYCFEDVEKGAEEAEENTEDEGDV